jgi:hypothetical protein
MLVAAAALALAVPAAAADFSFHAIVSLDAMQSTLKRTFSLGATEAAIDGTFRAAGAKRYKHPDLPGVEKWVYDINLCRTYVWRWNISANFDTAGELTQIFVNGEPVHARGDKPRDASEIAASNGKPQAIYKGTLPRPEASLGENSLAFIMFDVDTTSNKASDQFVNGAGPTRADPIDLGSLHVYNTELWRSIFDGDRANSVVDFSGTCPEAA